MKRKITVAVFNEATYSSRQIAFSRASMVGAACLIMIGLSLWGSLMVRYSTLRHATTDPVLLQNEITAKNQQLTVYNEQLNFLNDKLLALQTRMQDLRGLEGQIREIARIKPSADDNTVFGVGGTRADSAAVDNKACVDGIDRKMSAGKATNPASAGCPVGGEDRALILQDADVSINPITSLPASLPVNGAIVKKFDIYTSDLTGNQELHKGIAIKSDPLVGVRTPACGVVSYHKTEANGNIVMIDHGHGFTTRYTYLTNLSKQVGDRINEGEIIGYLPDDTAAHADKHQLHYELLFNGVQVNPETFISQCPFLL